MDMRIILCVSESQEKETHLPMLIDDRLCENSYPRYV